MKLSDVRYEWSIIQCSVHNTLFWGVVQMFGTDGIPVCRLRLIGEIPLKKTWRSQKTHWKWRVKHFIL